MQKIRAKAVGGGSATHINVSMYICASVNGNAGLVSSVALASIAIGLQWAQAHARVCM